jgi:nucleotide-binding universal stress UspA family protein
MFDRVMLLTDLGDQPELTLKPLQVISEVCGSKLIIFHAVRGSSDLFYLEGEAAKVRALIDQQAEQAAMPKLEALAATFEAAGISTGIVTRIGSTFDLAVRAIEELMIDLVVIPQEGFADFTDRVTGSTTARIIRETDVPVLTMNQSFSKNAETWTGFHRNLVPYDFGNTSDDHMSAAEDFAVEFGGRLEVVHVVQPIHQQTLETPEGQVLLPKDLHYQVKARLETQLSDAAHRITRVPSEWRLLEDNKPGSGLMSYADRAGHDLIIVPPIGRADTRNTVLGSVAEHVIKHARVPVLTLKKGWRA